jgi:S-adenosylmethionine/arginine decarboxylase-like enzyme
MRNLAPQVFRQRLLIEGLYTVDIDRPQVADYMTGLAAHLGLQAYGEPTIHSPSGLGKAGNQGFDAFLPLIDSGISVYVWSSARFFAVVLFTCKGFDEHSAIEYTRRCLGASEVESMAF